MMKKLISPIRVGDIMLKNRIAVSPMCQYSSVDGFASDWHLVHIGSRAVGGAGLVMMEATAISPEGRISPDDLGIWRTEHLEKLSQITAFVETQGSVPGIQLAHAGRKASTYAPFKGYGQVGITDGGWQTYAPSAIAYAENYPQPLALDEAGLKKVITDFEQAAEKAIAAGFKVIEVHAAHGYLLHQFLSPLSNRRTDNYGGSFENRIRLLVEVIAVVKAKLTAGTALVVRISATDWADGGWDLEQSIRLANHLKNNGVDLLDVSTGGLAQHQSIPVGPAYQVPFASMIKKETGILTAAVGLITNARQAETILDNDDADLIFMAREFLRDPYFPLRAAHELNADIVWPKQYERGKW